MQNDKWIGKKAFVPVVCIDLDGVVFDFSNGWQGADVFGAIIDGAQNAIKKLRQHGWKVILFTSRLPTKSLVDYLEDNGIEFDEINGINFDDIPLLHRLGLLPSYENVNSFRKLHEWLGRRNVLNGRVAHFWSMHNEYPTEVSFKPIATAYLDDMNIENGGKQYTAEKWDSVLNTLLTQ